MKSESQFISEALSVLCPNGAGYNGVDITPTSDPVPTQSELDAQVVIQKAEYATQEYARDRKEEYDALNQFELISDDANNGTTTHKDAVNAIKTKYPKP